MLFDLHQFCRRPTSSLRERAATNSTGAAEPGARHVRCFGQFGRRLGIALRRLGAGPRYGTALTACAESEPQFSPYGGFRLGAFSFDRTHLDNARQISRLNKILRSRNTINAER